MDEIIVKPMISVVIPVYNVSNYLRECLDSVVNQTFKDIEIICINDGSTDNSLEILEEYAKNDSRIKIINQANKGLGATRNCGAKFAKGEYLYFLDSDDWLDLHCLEKLYDKIMQENSDICLLGQYIYEDGTNSFRLIDYYDANLYKLDETLFFSRFEIFLKLYKRSFFIDNNLIFPEGVWFEDVLVSIKGYLFTDKISILRENLHYYRVRKSSIMNQSLNNKKVWEIFTVIDSVENVLKANNLYEKYQINFIEFTLRQLIFHYQRINNKELKKKFYYDVKLYIKENGLDRICKKNRALKNIFCFYNYCLSSKLRKCVNKVFSVYFINDGCYKRIYITILGIKYAHKIRIQGGL